MLHLSVFCLHKNGKYCSIFDLSVVKQKSLIKFKPTLCLFLEQKLDFDQKNFSNTFSMIRRAAQVKA